MLTVSVLDLTPTTDGTHERPSCTLDPAPSIRLGGEGSMRISGRSVAGALGSAMIAVESVTEYVAELFSVKIVDCDWKNTYDAGIVMIDVEDSIALPIVGQISV